MHDDLKVVFTPEELELKARMQGLRASVPHEAFQVGAEIATKNLMDRTIVFLREVADDALVKSWLRRVTADPSHDELVAIEDLNADVAAYRAARAS